MGKVIVIACSLVVAVIMSYIAVSHNFGDLCIIRDGEYSCSEWDYKTIIVYVLTYLFYGAVLGLAINYFIKKVKSHP
jgi:uncharacterized membrane protein